MLLANNSSFIKLCRHMMYLIYNGYKDVKKGFYYFKVIWLQEVKLFHP